MFLKVQSSVWPDDTQIKGFSALIKFQEIWGRRWGLERDSQKQNAQIIYPNVASPAKLLSLLWERCLGLAGRKRQLHQTITIKRSPSWTLNTINPGETELVLLYDKAFSWNPETSNPGTGIEKPGLMLADTGVSIGSTKAFLMLCLHKHLIKMRCESSR